MAVSPNGTRKKSGVLVLDDWLPACRPRDARSNESRGNGGNNSNCWELLLGLIAGTLAISLRDSKEVKVYGDDTEVFHLGRATASLLDLAAYRPELSDPEFYRGLATELALPLNGQGLRITPIVHDEFAPGTHVVHFGDRRGPTMSANETAGLFVCLAEIAKTVAIDGNAVTADWRTAPTTI